MTVANTARGEVPVTIAGQRFVIEPDLKRLMALCERAGVETYPELINKIGRCDLDCIHAALDCLIDAPDDGLPKVYPADLLAVQTALLAALNPDLGGAEKNAPGARGKRSKNSPGATG